MQNFFLVSVAIGFFSGTTLTAKAQPAVNMEQVDLAVTKKSTTSANTTEFKLAIETLQAVAEVSPIESFTALQFKYAQLLDVEVESITNRALFASIEKWWGTRYRYGGATAKGIDCSAYTGTLVHEVFGLVLARTARDQYANCIKLEREQMQQGDLVFFNTRGGISHVGLYLGNGYFTHSSTSIGVTISNLSDKYWSKKFLRGGRITVPAPETE
ncbi:MAG: C40 family peptidase [Ferruginibacter sp.]|nr:C40 family peptidase [Ferruginibacter sp.]